MPPIGLHGLRHSPASYLISQNASVIAVSHRLGHASPSVTLDIYGQVLPDDDRKLAEIAGSGGHGAVKNKKEPPKP